MELHTHNTKPNLSTEERDLEHGAGHLKTLGLGADLRLFVELLARASGLHLPVHSIARKRITRLVQTGVSSMYPAFCTVTASGSIRRPAAGSFFCFGLRRLRLRFPSATDPP
jgi:hypothetical protein